MVEGVGQGHVPVAVEGALLRMSVCGRLVVGLGCVPGGPVELMTIGGVEKEKVVWGTEVVGLQVWTLLSMVPLAPQWAEMQPPVPSVVW